MKQRIEDIETMCCYIRILREDIDGEIHEYCWQCGKENPDTQPAGTHKANLKEQMAYEEGEERSDSAAKRIIAAIMPAPEKHPLWKDPCEMCGEWIRLKDKEAHMKTHQEELVRLPQPTDEELERMHDAWDYERVESESKQYQNAH